MTASLKAAVRAVLPRAATDAIFRMFLRRRAIMRAIESFAPREVSHVYCGVPLRSALEDPTAEDWYDRDWPPLPELAELQQRGLRAGALVFDVGAHQAVVALVLAHIVGPRGRVVAVEAEPHNVRVARRNLELNEVRSVTIVPAAVADRAGTVRFAEGLNGRIAEGSAGTIAVDAMTIDGLAGEHGEPDVVFVDVEGAEAAALAGARDTLRRGHATWFVEVHHGLGLQPAGGATEQVLAAFPRERFDLLVAGRHRRPHASLQPAGRSRTRRSLLPDRRSACGDRRLIVAPPPTA